MYTIHDCTDEDVYCENLEGRYVIIKEEFFKPEFMDEKYQIVLCTGGFGCDPTKLGNAIFVRELNSESETDKLDRRDKGILGFAKDSIVQAHKEKYCTS